MRNQPLHHGVSIPNVAPSIPSEAVSDYLDDTNDYLKRPLVYVEPATLREVAKYLAENNYDMSAKFLEEEADSMVSSAQMNEITTRAADEITKIFEPWFDADSRKFGGPSRSGRADVRNVIKEAILKYDALVRKS